MTWGSKSIQLMMSNSEHRITWCPMVGARLHQGPVACQELHFLKILGIVPLQCCVSFCSTKKWISYMFTCISFLLDLLPISPQFHPLGHHRAPTELLMLLPTNYLFYISPCTVHKFSSNLPIHPTTCPPHHVHTCIAYAYISISDLQIS